MVEKKEFGRSADQTARVVHQECVDAAAKCEGGVMAGMRR